MLSKSSLKLLKFKRYDININTNTIIKRLFSANDEYKIKINQKPLKTNQFGIDVLHDPLWNKGTGFNYAERDRLGLRGLVPPAYRTIEEQAARVLKHIENEPSDEKKNMYLQSLHNRNETLYFRVLVENIDKMAPLVYTPTVGMVFE